MQELGRAKIRVIHQSPRVFRTGWIGRQRVRLDLYGVLSICCPRTYLAGQRSPKPRCLPVCLPLVSPKGGRATRYFPFQDPGPAQGESVRPRVMAAGRSNREVAIGHSHRVRRRVGPPDRAPESDPWGSRRTEGTGWWLARRKSGRSRGAVAPCRAGRRKGPAVYTNNCVKTSDGEDITVAGVHFHGQSVAFPLLVPQPDFCLLHLFIRGAKTWSASAKPSNKSRK